GLAASLALPPIVRGGGVGWGFATLGLACVASAVAATSVLRERPREADHPVVELPPFRDRRIWTLASGSALIVAPQMCVVGFTVLCLHDRGGLSLSHAAAVLAVVQFLGIGARIAAGRWSDVLRSRIVPMRRIALATAVLVAITAALVTAPVPLLLPALVLAGALSM